ncbi:hypothetical protein [Chelativorans salis]|uniref:Terminase small subunit n=1 Tax=Chelativorans salis TaxID=2978478 RepID=A0ABT2LG40_9HYPH|nr:hypothetical protein [Chelativorans sp. EGI FJ00035]MCT7373435.1 hypothetical protein [Chelativorans sp. EGI FJ00035]
MPLRYVPSMRVRRRARKVMESGRVTPDDLADLTGRSVKHWLDVARVEGWRMANAERPPDEKAPESPAETDPEALEKRLVALSDELVSELEAAVGEGRASGTYDKGRIDALSAMLRMVEKIGEMTRVPERAAERQKKSDEELAAALALVDARIVELACELAATMGGGEVEPTDSGEGAG